MKTIGLIATTAAACAFATSAMAADLGGNCCADLEERIAELEATTARKGNRKVKLTVGGQVNEAILFWDDGRETNTYIGTNMVSQTRFRFVGDAKISDTLSAGYLLEIGVTAPAVSQSTAANDDAGGSGLNIRHSAWWINHKNLGKVWVGQTSQSTDGITEINIANVGHFATQNSSSYNGGFFARTAVNGPAGNAPPFNAGNPANGITLSSLYGGRPGERDSAQIGEGTRFNVVKYDSPTIAGFVLSASWGEDDFWDVALKYAGEHHGFKVAFGVGYSEWTDGNAGQANERGCILSGPTNHDQKCQHLGASGSIMHVATGLYIHGAYGHMNDDNARTPPLGTQDDESTMWYVQAGIEQNFFGIGRTTVFGEYQTWDTGTTTATVLFDTAEASMWGLGVNQSIDAAVMDIYLHYRNYNDLSCTGGAASTCRSAAVNGVGLPAGTTNFKDFQTIMVGANIKF